MPNLTELRVELQQSRAITYLTHMPKLEDNVESRAVYSLNCNYIRFLNLLDIMQHFMCWQLVKVIDFLKDCESLVSYTSPQVHDLPISPNEVRTHYQPALEYAA